MKKVLKWIVIVLIVLVFAGIGGYQYMKMETKKHSPEENIEYAVSDHKFNVFYCRPYKKGRKIFGELVPFDQVWRTGANEATTFTTAKDVTIGGQTLKAGNYTLWTIPGEDKWKVIFNNGEYGWGVNFSAQAARDPLKDELETEVPVQQLGVPIEQFTIYFEDSDPVNMVLAWDETQVVIPIY